MVTLYVLYFCALADFLADGTDVSSRARSPLSGSSASGTRSSSLMRTPPTRLRPPSRSSRSSPTLAPARPRLTTKALPKEATADRDLGSTSPTRRTRILSRKPRSRSPRGPNTLMTTAPSFSTTSVLARPNSSSSTLLRATTTSRRSLRLASSPSSPPRAVWVVGRRPFFSSFRADSFFFIFFLWQSTGFQTSLR